MPRILGVDLPNNKLTYITLQYLYGVGQALAIKVCFELGIDPQIKASQLTEDEVSQITKHLESNYLVEGPLRRSVAQDITLQDIFHRGLDNGVHLIRGGKASTKRTDVSFNNVAIRAWLWLPTT